MDIKPSLNNKRNEIRHLTSRSKTHAGTHKQDIKRKVVRRDVCRSVRREGMRLDEYSTPFERIVGEPLKHLLSQVLIPGDFTPFILQIRDIGVTTQQFD